MIPTCSKPRSSNACRIAATLPSIMSDGATKSAPATACDSATWTRCETVTSLTISSPSRMPQCPCEVYSQRQTSVMTIRSGTWRFISRTAHWTGASGSAASEPTASLRSGRPNSSTPGTPSAFAAAASLTASSTDSWKTPGIDGTSRRTPLPSQTNSGSTKQSGVRCVSRTSRRIASVRRSRRGRRASVRREAVLTAIPSILDPNHVPRRWSGRPEPLSKRPRSRRRVPAPPFARHLLGPGAGAVDFSEPARQLARRLRTQRGILRQARQNQAIERVGNRQLGPGRGRNRRRLRVMQQQSHRSRGLEHQLPGDQPVADAAGGVNVGAAVEVGLPERLLGSHVRRRAVNRQLPSQRDAGFRAVVCGLDDPEIEDLDEVEFLAISAQEYVGRLDVAMHQAT